MVWFKVYRPEQVIPPFILGGYWDRSTYSDDKFLLDQEIVAGFLHRIKLGVRVLPHASHHNLCAFISKAPSLRLRKICVKLPTKERRSRITGTGVGIHTYGIRGVGGGKFPPGGAVQSLKIKRPQMRLRLRFTSFSAIARLLVSIIADGQRLPLGRGVGGWSSRAGRSILLRHSRLLARLPRGGSRACGHRSLRCSGQ